MFNSARKFIAAAAALAALALGASAIAGAAGSSTSTSPAARAAGPSSIPPRPPGLRDMPAHGTAAHEDAEKAVTGEAAKKAQEAAVKAAGGGKAGAVTTDYTQRGFEVTVTKPDGSQVEIHLDSSFNALRGPLRGPVGGPAGAGANGAPPHPAIAG